MSIVRNGGIIGPLNSPTTSVASGVWDMARMVPYLNANTWPSPVQTLTVDALIVAGGGSGASADGNSMGGGGGGAGGAKIFSSLTLPAGIASTVTVGAGGAAQTTNAKPGNSGSDSSFSDGVYKTTGGGGGGCASNVNGSALSGGSGGGASADASGSGNITPGSGITGEGNAGGDNFNQIEVTAGGGGGKNSPGAAAALGLGGNGGSGYDLANFIGGSASYVAGGGGGGTKTGVGGSGGSGVGGSGSGNSPTATAATGGAIYTGSGGGGGGNVKTGAAGSGGNAIIRYPGSSAQAYGGTISTATVSGTSYICHRFNATGTFTPASTIALRDYEFVTGAATVTVPNTTQPGDIVVYSEMADGMGASVTAPSGFTLINLQGGACGYVNAYTVADATTAGSSLSTGSDTKADNTKVVYVFKPPKSSLTVTAASVNGLSDATPSIPLSSQTLSLVSGGNNAPFLLFYAAQLRGSTDFTVSTSNYTFTQINTNPPTNFTALRGFYVLQGGEALANCVITPATTTGGAREIFSSFYLYFS